VGTLRLGTLGLSLVLLQGCYLHHERGTGREPVEALPTPDAGPRRDVGVAPRGDAGWEPIWDAGPEPVADAGPPLPAEPDPDLGPDARPSDYPEADEWLDPPATGEDEACCELGEPILVTSRDEGTALSHDPPRIAWGPGRWGLLVTRQFSRPDFEYEPRAIVFELSADGRPLGPPRVLDRITDYAESIRWAEGRWAVAVTGDGAGGSLRQIYARLFDRDLRPASEWASLGIGERRLVDLARLSHGDRWLGILGGEGHLRVSPFHDLGTDPSVEHASVTPSTLRAVGLRSRVAVLVGQDEEGSARNELVVLGSGPGYAPLGRVALATRYRDHAALAALRDLVIAAGIEGGQARVEVIDPFDVTLVAGPRTLGAAAGSIESSSDAVGAAGSSKLGVAGVCYGVGMGTEPRDMERGIDFRLVGLDGAPRGRAVRIVDSHFRAGLVNCAVGSDDLGFLVGWWDGSALWVRRVLVTR